MPASLVSQLGRRKRQLDTLRVMLAGVDEIPQAISTIGQERDLKPDEIAEAESLAARRERIVKGIAETEDNLGHARR